MLQDRLVTVDIQIRLTLASKRRFGRIFSRRRRTHGDVYSSAVLLAQLVIGFGDRRSNIGGHRRGGDDVASQLCAAVHFKVIVVAGVGKTGAQSLLQRGAAQRFEMHLVQAFGHWNLIPIAAF